MSPDDAASTAAASTAPPRPTLFEALSPWTVGLLVLGCLVLDQVLTAVIWATGHHATAILVASILGIGVPLAGVLRGLDLPWRLELGLHALRAREVLLVVWILGAALPPIYALDALSERCFPPRPEHLDFYAGLRPHDVATWVGGLLAVVVVGPLAEELLFRRLLLQLGVRLLAVPIAIVATGILFGVVHGALWSLLPLAVLGILLGFLAWTTRNVTSAWLAHALFNLAAFLELGVLGDPRALWLQQWSRHAILWIPSAVVACVGLVVLGRAAPGIRRRPETTRR